VTEDTIAALATSPGPSAVGMVRMSGLEAVAICDRVFRGKISPAQAADRTVILGEIVSSDGSPIDQVLVVVMRRPRSLTGEDVAEITCHGGNLAPRLVLRRLIEAGARAAEPGEFTKRAFLNGKMDLAQAEAVAEIVHASSEKALEVAVRQLKGELSDRCSGIEESLLNWLAAIEADIDFVEDEIEPVDRSALDRDLARVGRDVAGLAASYEQGRYIKDGIDVTIVGKPNVGKSSLFNRLVGHDRVIVSTSPGTTRDVVDGLVRVNGVILRLHDTAGVRDGVGSIEAEALRRTRQAIDEADIALVVLDVSTPLTDEDLSIIGEVASKAHIVALNKTDLPKRAATDGFEGALDVSALQGWGFPDLVEHLRLLAEAKVEHLNYEVIVSERHVACLRRAREAVERAGRALGEGLSLEFVASDLRTALDAVGGITGRNVSSEVLDRIFSRFCIGK
jgi:tRNA modification GTPase